jgi:hypothetical protein
MSKPKHKPYPQMTTDELAAATADLDREHAGTPGRPLNRREREEHRKARKMGRPKIGQGVKVISLSVEQGLLKRADALAKRRKISRAKLVSQALRAVLSGEAEHSAGATRGEAGRKPSRSKSVSQNAA